MVPNNALNNQDTRRQPDFLPRWHFDKMKLGVLYLQVLSQNMEHILTSQRASEILRPQFDTCVEELRVIALASDKSIISMACIFRGTSDACLIHPRDILRFAIVNCASGFIMAHNHPFGCAQPSPEDILITKKIAIGAHAVQIEFVDHIIIGRTDYFSFADKNLLRIRSRRISS